VQVEAALVVRGARKTIDTMSNTVVIKTVATKFRRYISKDIIVVTY
jgi:hypothetical protein